MKFVVQTIGRSGGIIEQYFDDLASAQYFAISHRLTFDRIKLGDLTVYDTIEEVESNGYLLYKLSVKK